MSTEVLQKTNEFDKLICRMGDCKKCMSMITKNKKDYSLINIFEDQEFCKNIPSIWTDWYNRLEAQIMIIGQDWGPYSDMQKIMEQYCKEKTNKKWKEIIEEEKSNTKKMLTKYIIASSPIRINNLDNIYITNTIMCARQGNSYRGNNINLKKSTENCKEYIRDQIEIVSPKVVLTLGYYPLYSLSILYNFKIEKNLKETINKISVIKLENFVIIPLYHPVAQIKKEEQLLQYNKIWKYL